jgi:flagellar hook protein FlgE
MIDSIYIALSGMLGHEKGLNVIGNNVTNMNTLGFRGSNVSFADVFLGTAPNGLGAGNDDRRAIGGGVDASKTTVDFHGGTAQTTGLELDAALDGDGFFIVQDETGAIRYTRAGAFDVVDDALVLKGQKTKVMTRDASGKLLPITLEDLKTNAGQATTKLALAGNFKTDDTDFTIDSRDLFDKNGGKHTVKLVFTFKKGGTPENPVPEDSWHLSVTEGGEEIGVGDLIFHSGFPDLEPLNIQLKLGGSDPIDISLDYSTLQIQPGGDDSSVSVSESDGFSVGQITGKTFDAKGVLKISYSNGQSADGPKLALAQFIDQSALVQVGDALFEYRGTQPVTIREAADDLKVTPHSLEGSNVDLTAEFSQLILMQRGYQASSQVMSTANDMLQELFDLRGRR